MTIWGISDLHLSMARPDRRDPYNERRPDHAGRIAEEWRRVVRREDLVLLPGDLSMARNHREVQPDLAWLASLPGTKVLSAGNHDFWFNRIGRVRPILRRSLLAVGGDALATHGLIVCGTRGAPVVPSGDPGTERSKAFEEELAALDRALEHAARLRQAGERLYVLWHYPPFDSNQRPGPVVSRLEAAGATACVYGHLHNEGDWARAVQGVVNGVRYACVAADAIGFRPLRIDARG